MAYLMEPKTVAVIGAPVALGQNLQGVDRAPEFLRKAGLQQSIKELGWGYEDNGDLWPELLKSENEAVGGVKYAREVGLACRHLEDKVAKLAQAGQFVLTLGGDHSIALGTISGVLRARPEATVIWVDAHGDFNTPETSPSGHIHGMPLAGLMGYFKPGSLPGFEWLKPSLTPDRVALVGVRSVDRAERELLRKSGIKVFTMLEIDRYGIGVVMEMALEATNPERNRPIHLSLDIDGLDPNIAPSTGTKARGGLTYREGHYICETLAETGLLGSMDLVEINPQISHLFDGTGMSNTEQMNATVELGIELVASALGKRIL